ncbi:MAG: putative sulfate exporter family transporter, partial [Blastomonas fulva]
MKRQEIDWDSLPAAGDLFGEMYLADAGPKPTSQTPSEPAKPRETVFQGLVICAIAAAAAAWLSEHYM